MSSRSSLSFLLLLLLSLSLLFLSSPSVVRSDSDSSSSDDDSIGLDASEDMDVSDDDSGEVEVDESFDSEFAEGPDSTNSDLQYNFMSHPDVSTSVYFPNYPSKDFEIGEEIVVLVGFSNSGSKTFNLTYTGANLLSPEDANFYIQNFTVSPIGQLVDPGHELTFEYRFRTAEQLEAAEYRLAAWVLYNGTEGGIFFNTYFNQTVEISEKNKGLFGDIGRLVTIFLLLVALGGGGYFAYTAATGGTKKKRKTRGPSDEKKPPPEWEITAYKPAAKQKVFGAKKRSQKKEKDTGAGEKAAENANQTQTE